MGALRYQCCGTLFSRNSAIEPDDADGCLLPDGHEGPHRFLDGPGQHYAWETDIECTCEHCMQGDGDYCSVYWKVDAAGAG